MKAHEVLQETGMIHEGPHDPYYRKRVDGTLTKFRKSDDFDEGPEQFLHVSGRQWFPWRQKAYVACDEHQSVRATHWRQGLIRRGIKIFLCDECVKPCKALLVNVYKIEQETGSTS